MPLPEELLLALPEGATLLLTDGEAPLLRAADGLPDIVELELSVEEGELEGVAVLLPVCVPLGLGDWLRVGERLLLLLSLPVAEALAPRVREAVGDPDTEELRLVLLEGEGAALLLPDCVCVPLPVTLDVAEGDLLPEDESEPVAEGEAPALKVPEGVAL